MPKKTKLKSGRKRNPATRKESPNAREAKLRHPVIEGEDFNQVAFRAVQETIRRAES
ncbi:MAG: hypothetical protein WB763_16205 [Terriglobia bacterium]